MRDTRPVVWLCGFPSSGNLKAQIGLANLLFGRVETITQLDSRIPVMGISPHIPSSPTSTPLNFVFTHHLANRHMLAQVNSYRIIYVVRSPVDAGISSAGYLLPRRVDMLTANDIALTKAKDELISEFLTLGSFAEYVSYGYGTWQTHVSSWLDFSHKSRVPLLTLKFEDMRRNGPSVLRAVADFIGVSTSDDRIADAIENWSISASSAMEELALANGERSRFFKPEWINAYSRGWRYHGKGLSGYGKERLTDDQWMRARLMFGPLAEGRCIDIG